LDMNNAASEILGYKKDLYFNDKETILIRDIHNEKYSDISDIYRPVMLALRDSNQMGTIVDFSNVIMFIIMGLFLIVVIILLIITQKALYSPWGRMMRAIRDNEEAASAMGKNVVKEHLLIFILGSAVVGIAGAMMVTNDGLFTPGSYRPMRYTFVIWVMVIVGGTGNNFGAILGGFVVWFLWVQAAPIALFIINLFTAHLPETNEIKIHLINSAPYFRFLIIGIGLLIIMRYRPQGVIPEKIIKH